MEANSSSSSFSARHQMPHYSTALHSVRRAAAPPSKAWKKSPAPAPPAPPRVYRVEPINFRDVVQKLTSAPEFLAGAPHRSSHAPLPPVELPAKASSLSAVYREFSDALVEDQKGFLGLNLSPSDVKMTSSQNWCSYAMLSPGSLSSLEQSSVL